MKAMVLAAGLGTRLRPLTDARPKALAEVGGRTLLEITLTRLRDAGVTDAIVNVHHFADQVADYLKQHHGFGMRIELSREDDLLLDTGGGLKKAGWFFEKDTQPFLVHNVDVLSNLDLRKLLDQHKKSKALATVAVQKREGARQLLFDDELQLCGRQKARGEKPQMVRVRPAPQPLAFCGIHVVSPRLLTMWKEDGVFSIIDTYLRLSGAGEEILGFRADEYYWRDLGKPESLAQAEHDIRSHKL